MIGTIFGCICLFFVCCAIWVWYECEHAPLIEFVPASRARIMGKKSQMIGDLLAAAAHHRDQADAHQTTLSELADELIRIEGYEIDSVEGYILADIVLDGRNYEDTIRRLMHMRYG